MTINHRVYLLHHGLDARVIENCIPDYANRRNFMNVIIHGLVSIEASYSIMFLQNGGRAMNVFKKCCL